MTTVAPIDLERDRLECVALIDLENIRLSWQRTYGKLFEYADLVMLCGLTERLMDSAMTRIVLFATKPDEYHAQQVKLLALREKLWSGPTHHQLEKAEVDKFEAELQQRGIDLPPDIKAVDALIGKLQEDASRSIKSEAALPLRKPARLPNRKRRREIQIIDDSDNECVILEQTPKLADVDVSSGDDSLEPLSDESDNELEIVEDESADQDDEVQVVAAPLCKRKAEKIEQRLTGVDGCCKVELRLYGFKTMKGRVVQRGCDVALGAEITKACFHPNVDKICLFSADSDFQELMQQNLQAEDIGGVVKYAKTSWVCGFRDSFTSNRITGLNLKRQRRLARGPPESNVITHGNIRYVLIDEVFPQIRSFLDMKRTHRQPWNPIYRSKSPAAVEPSKSANPPAMPAPRQPLIGTAEAPRLPVGNGVRNKVAPRSVKTLLPPVVQQPPPPPPRPLSTCKRRRWEPCKPDTWTPIQVTALSYEAPTDGRNFVSVAFPAGS